MNAKLLAAALAGALLSAVVLYWLPGRTRSMGSNPVAPASTDLSALASAIEKLEQRLARIETSLAVQDSRGSREPADPASPTPAAPEDPHTALQELSTRIDTLTASLRDTRKPVAQYPTLEQMRSARADIDWNFVDAVRRVWREDHVAGLERVRLMTFDDLLRKVGTPTGIDARNGNWEYTRLVTDSDGDPTWRGITLHFINDYVMDVVGDGDD